PAMVHQQIQAQYILIKRFGNSDIGALDIGDNTFDFHESGSSDGRYVDHALTASPVVLTIAGVDAGMQVGWQMVDIHLPRILTRVRTDCLPSRPRCELMCRSDRD